YNPVRGEQRKAGSRTRSNMIANTTSCPILAGVLPMKIASLLAVSCAFLAVPAAAGVVHQTSLSHDGGTLSVRYEPVTKTELRQSGLGPRAQAACLWTAEVSVERKLLDASGRPIEAL